MSEGMKNFLKMLIILVIIFVNFKLISLNKGYINAQPVGGPSMKYSSSSGSRYINHGGLYNLLGQDRVKTYVFISICSTILATLVYLKDLTKKSKKALVIFIVITFICVLTLNTLFIHFPMTTVV